MNPDTDDEAAAKPGASPEATLHTKVDAVAFASAVAAFTSSTSCLESGIAIKPDAKSEAKPRANADAKPAADLATQIATQAYALYEEHGHHDGHAVEDWLQAERAVRGKQLHK